MNRESIVTGLLGLGLGLALCSVILALTFSRVAGGEELTWTYGTRLIRINWVWLSNLFLTCGLGMFVVAALMPVLRRVSLRTLAASLPLSAVYLLISALDVVTTRVLIDSGMGDEVNPFMAALMNVFGTSYALSLNFAVSLFVIIALLYFAERLPLFSAVVLLISFVRGLVVHSNMNIVEGYTLSTWLAALESSLIESVPTAILFALSVVLGVTTAFAFPEEEEELPQPGERPSPGERPPFGERPPSGERPSPGERPQPLSTPIPGSTLLRALRAGAGSGGGGDEDKGELRLPLRSPPSTAASAASAAPSAASSASASSAGGGRAVRVAEEAAGRVAEEAAERAAGRAADAEGAAGRAAEEVAGGVAGDLGVGAVELAFLLERFRMEREVLEALLEVSREVSRRKGIPVSKVTLQDVIEELKRRY